MRFFYCHFIRGRHDPKRHPLGAFRCVDCGEAGESLDDMGFPGGGWVPPLRRTFSRRHGGSIERSVGHEEPVRDWRNW